MVHSFLLLIYSVSLQTIAQAIAAEGSPSACQVGKGGKCTSKKRGNLFADLDIDDLSLLQRKREGLGEVGENMEGKEESLLQTMETQKEDVPRNTGKEAKKRLLNMLQRIQRLPKDAQKKAMQLIKASEWYQKYHKKGGMHSQKKAPSVTESSKKIQRLVNMLQQRLPTNSALKAELERLQKTKGPRGAQLKKLQRVMKMKRLLSMLQRLPSSVVMRALKKVKKAKQLKIDDSSQKETEQNIDDDASFLQRLRGSASKEADKTSVQKESVQTGAMPQTTKQIAKRLLDLLQRMPKGPARKRALKQIKESKWFQKQMQKAGMLQKKS